MRDRQQAVLVLVAISVPLAAFAINDWFAAGGWGPRLAQMWAVRATMLAVLAWIIRVLARCPSRERFERVLFWALNAGALVSIAMHLSRPRDSLVVTRFELLCIVGYYVALPLRTRLRLVPALILTGASTALVIWWHVNVPVMELVSHFICFSLANALGWLISVRGERTDEKEETAWKALVATNKALRSTLTELRALRGIVPICPSCRKVRGSRDAWQQLEAFVAERGDVTFSPILCPSCLEHEFGAVLPDATQ